MQMVHVRGVDESVHRGVDRGRGASLAVQAVVERRDHLVLALDARVHPGQRPQPVQPQHGQPRPGQRAEIPAGSLDPHQFDVTTGDGIGPDTLRGGVPPGVVGIARIATEPMRPPEQFSDCGMGCHEHPVLT